MQQEYLEALTAKALADERVAAAWLEGSLGRGNPDRYSDIDAHFLIQPQDGADFGQEAEAWLDQIQPLVLFRTMFDGQMLNCLTQEGLRLDLWLQPVAAVTLAASQVQVLFDHAGTITLEATSAAPALDVPALLNRHIGEFWRCISLTPTVLGRDERIVSVMGLQAELVPLTEVLMIGDGTRRDAGVKTLNRFLPAPARQALEAALDLQGLSLESLARVHLRLARVMQDHGPAVAQRWGWDYPLELEQAVLRYVARELDLIGLGASLAEVRYPA